MLAISPATINFTRVESLARGSACIKLFHPPFTPNFLALGCVMVTDPPFGSDVEAKHVQRMVSSMETLNIRIARLAIGLDVSLSSRSEVALLMTSHPAQSDLPLARQREELRGLLVLRYGVETSYVEQVGSTATRQILVEAEQHLLLKGFHLGDDGIDPDFLFIKP
jgi:hypothetical protein